MSIQRCHDCDKDIDTDFDVDHFDEHVKNNPMKTALEFLQENIDETNIPEQWYEEEIAQMMEWYAGGYSQDKIEEGAANYRRDYEQKHIASAVAVEREKIVRDIETLNDSVDTLPDDVGMTPESGYHHAVYQIIATIEEKDDFAEPLEGRCSSCSTR